MKSFLTSCTQDCPDTCSILVEKQGDRIKSIRGNPDFELTRGFLCRKARNFLPRLYSPERILEPLVKQGGNWRSTTWQKAIDMIARKLDDSISKYGVLSIYYFRDSGSISALKIVNDRFFNLLGGATFATGSLCGGAGIAGQTMDFGKRISHDPMDLLNARTVIIWGRNPVWTNVHMVPILKQARKSGAYCVLIDPLRTPTAKIVDWYISITPSSDCYLIIGMIKVILELNLVDHDFIKDHTLNYETLVESIKAYDLRWISEKVGLDVAQIVRLARLYAENKPSAIIGGWGVQRKRHGAQLYRLLDALAAITGNIGIAGGGVSHGYDEMRWFDTGVSLSDKGVRREIPKPMTASGILNASAPPLKVGFVSGANPACQCPNTIGVKKALRSLDLLVVIDMFMTDTASLADIVLPCTFFLQESDLVGSYWHNYVMPVNIVENRLGNEKTDLEIFALLARTMGLESEFPEDPDFFLEQMIRPLKSHGASLALLKSGPYRPPGVSKVAFADKRFETISGKFEFISRFEPMGERTSGDYPYYLLTPHPADRTHSQMPSPPPQGLPVVRISRRLANLLDVADRGRVLVTTPYGELVGRCWVIDDLRDDVVILEEGNWEISGGSVNRLTSEEMSDHGECATFNDVPCRIRAV